VRKLFKFVLVFSLLLLASAAFAQAPVSGSFGHGVYYSPAYAYGSSFTGPGPLRVSVGAAAGTTTITLTNGYVILTDGRKIYPFTGVPSLPSILIDLGGSSETVTPSSASCSTPEIPNTCQLTATFTYAHGAGATVSSGSGGISEAINDAAINGGGVVYWTIDPGIVTLSTGGANTTLGSVNIPTRSVVLGATARVTTTVTGCSGGWSLGYSSGTEFGAANTTLTAGTTTDSSTLSYAVAFNASATAPIAKCTTSNATAGAIHPHFWGYKFVAPAN
jgi:hypothetical protein